MIKFKKSNIEKLAKSKKSEFAKANFFGSTFFTTKAKLAFTQLKQAFTKTFILYYFDLKCHIYIKMDIFRFINCEILSQMKLDYVTNKNLDLNFAKSKIDLWHQQKIFFEK